MSRFADKNSRLNWWRIGLALVVSGQAMMISLGLNLAEEPPEFGGVLYWSLHGVLIVSALVVLFLLGGPLFVNFFESFRQKKITVEALFLVSLVGAFVLSLHSSFTGSGSIYYEVVSLVVLIYTFGNTLRAKAFAEARQILSSARAAYAFVWQRQSDGSLKKTPVEALKTGDVVVVKPGELITVDGIVESGRAFVVMASITGEPSEVLVEAGSRVSAGAVSVDGMLTIRVGSTARSIDAIFETLASPTPSITEQLADRVVGWFLPIVVGITIISFFIWLPFRGAGFALECAMSVMLVSCPCALGIATPLCVQMFFHRLGAWGWRGRDGSFVEKLPQVDTIFFDKTGTLTLSDLKINFVSTSESITEKFSEEEIKGIAALVEQAVEQPIARAFKEWSPIADAKLEVLKVHAGEGISAEVLFQNKTLKVLLGRKEFIEAQENLSGTWTHEKESKRKVWMSISNTRAAIIGLNEEPAPESNQLLETLLQKGYEIEILTGDPQPAVKFDARIKVHVGLKPEDKKHLVEAAQKYTPERKGKNVLFIGDGLNDALAMKAAFASIALSGGASLTHAAADVVTTTQGLTFLPLAVSLAHRSVRILDWNLRFSALYNLLGIALAAGGLLHPIAASLLMLSSSVVVAWRALAAVNASGGDESY